MVEGTHEELDLLLVLHAIGILAAFGVTAHDQFVLEVLEDVDCELRHLG